MTKVLKIAFLIVNLAVTALFLLSTLAGMWQPVGRLSVGVSLLSYGFVILFILNMLCSVIWLIFGSRWFLLSLGAMLLRISYIPLYIQVGHANLDNSRDKAVTVLDFNMHSLAGPETDLTMQDTNAALFLQLVDSLKPDLLCLQEYINRTQSTYITRQLRKAGFKYCAGGAGIDLKKPGNSVIFSRFPIIASERIGGNSKFYADIVVYGDTLRVFCLHLDSYLLNESDREEVDRIKGGDFLDEMGKNGFGGLDSAGMGTLRKFVRTIRSHGKEWQSMEPHVAAPPYPTLYCGDWNDTPASYFYQNLTKHANDAYRECGIGLSTTYHGPFPAFRIDYICHTADIRALEYRRIKNDLSDHYPILAVLALPTKE